MNKEQISHEDFYIRRYIFNPDKGTLVDRGKVVSGPPPDTYFNDSSLNDPTNYANVIMESNINCFGGSLDLNNVLHDTMDLFVIYRHSTGNYIGHASVQYNRFLSDITKDPSTDLHDTRDRNIIWNVCLHESAKGLGLCQFLIKRIIKGMDCYIISGFNIPYSDDFWLYAYTNNLSAIKCYRNTGFNPIYKSEDDLYTFMSTKYNQSSSANSSFSKRKRSSPKSISRRLASPKSISRRLASPKSISRRLASPKSISRRASYMAYGFRR
jgi:hypothetical protein